MNHLNGKSIVIDIGDICVSPCLAFVLFQDGTKVFTASTDKQCKMWDLNTNQAIQVAQVCGLGSVVLLQGRPRRACVYCRPATIHRCTSASRYLLPRYEYHILNKLSRYLRYIYVCINKHGKHCLQLVLTLLLFLVLMHSDFRVIPKGEDFDWLVWFIGSIILWFWSKCWIIYDWVASICEVKHLYKMFHVSLFKEFLFLRLHCNWNSF